MTTNDPFERSGSEPDRPRPEHEAPHPASGYASPGQPAPEYAAPQPPASYVPAPGFTAGPPAIQYGAPFPERSPQAPNPASTDGVSIAALVTGIIGLGVVALALGAWGLRRTASGQRKGTWMAVVGLVLGVLGTIGATAAVTWLVTEAADSSLVEIGDAEGGSYGDDAHLDSLWNACDAGDNSACDDLFAESPWGSEYEDFGYSCGDRGRPLLQLSCEDGD